MEPIANENIQLSYSIEGELTNTSSLEENASARKTNTQSADRHRQLECKVCFRKMRSDILKRHMKTHRKLYTLDEEEIRDEIKQRKIK